MVLESWRLLLESSNCQCFSVLEGWSFHIFGNNGCGFRSKQKTKGTLRMVCQCCKMVSRDTYCDDNNVVLLCLCDPVMLLWVCFTLGLFLWIITDVINGVSVVHMYRLMSVTWVGDGYLNFRVLTLCGHRKTSFGWSHVNCIDTRRIFLKMMNLKWLCLGCGCLS
jgi:hypothetical protein